MQKPRAGRPYLLRPTPKNVMTPEELVLERQRLCPPPKPQAVVELCPCCGKGDGGYWVFPTAWSAAETLLWWTDYGPGARIKPGGNP